MTGKRQGEKSQDGRTRAPNPIHLQKFLGGLDYPAGKQDILQRARKQGADNPTMDVLEKIPDQQYPSPVAISREVGKLH